MERIKLEEYNEELKEENIQTLEDLTKNPEKGTIVRVFDPILRKECIRKIYNPFAYGNPPQKIDVEKLASIHEKIRNLQNRNQVFLKHTAEIFSVRIIEDNEDNKACIIEAFVHGETISEKLKQKEDEFLEFSEHHTQEDVPPARGFSEKEVIDYMLQICDCLSVLHYQVPPIVHRDIKPGNLMITDDGDICKIIDFDIAREVVEESIEDTVFSGTIGYAPAEQKGGGHQSVPASDIYALGVTMHKMLVGIMGHEEVTRGEDFSHAHGRMRYNGILRDIIIKCTQSELNDRYINADELKTDLLKASQVMDVNNKDSGKKYKEKKTNSRLRGCLIAVVSGMVLYLAIIMILAKFGTKTDNTTLYGHNAASTYDATIETHENITRQESLENTAKDVEIESDLESVEPEEVDVSAITKTEDDTNSGDNFGEIDESYTVDESIEEESSNNEAQSNIPPYQADIKQIEYVDGVNSLVDCDGEYFYISEFRDESGDMKCFLRSESGKEIDVSEYSSEFRVPRLAYNRYKNQLYLISHINDICQIYLVTDQMSLELLYEQDIVYDIVGKRWNCAFFSDGTMFYGIKGYYLDTDKWKICGQIPYNYVVIANDVVYVEDTLHEGYFCEFIDGGSNIEAFPSAKTLFSDGEVLYKVYGEHPGTLSYWDGEQWSSYIMDKDFSHYACLFLTKTDYGFLYYDHVYNQITKVVVK